MAQDHALRVAGCSRGIDDGRWSQGIHLREAHFHRRRVHLRDFPCIGNRKIRDPRTHRSFERRDLGRQTWVVENAPAVAVFDNKADFRRREIGIDRHYRNAMGDRAEKYGQKLRRVSKDDANGSTRLGACA